MHKLFVVYSSVFPNSICKCHPPHFIEISYFNPKFPFHVLGFYCSDNFLHYPPEC